MFCVQECFVLLCWTAVVLRQLQVQAAKKAAIKLIECQVCPLLLELLILKAACNFQLLGTTYLA